MSKMTKKELIKDIMDNASVLDEWQRTTSLEQAVEELEWAVLELKIRISEESD